MQRFSRSDLSKHHEIDDLWISVRGKVYNVTNYADDHPGGIEVLKDVAGSDGTESFEYVGHSEDAYKTLERFRIGVLLDHEHGNSLSQLATVWDAQRVQVEKPSKAKPVLIVKMMAAIVVIFVVGKSGHWLLRNRNASRREDGILHGGPCSSAWTWFCLGMALSTMIGVSGCLYIYGRFTKTLEYYKEVWEYPSYLVCKVNRAGI